MLASSRPHCDAILPFYIFIRVRPRKPRGMEVSYWLKIPVICKIIYFDAWKTFHMLYCLYISCIPAWRPDTEHGINVHSDLCLLKSAIWSLDHGICILHFFGFGLCY